MQNRIRTIILTALLYPLSCNSILLGQTIDEIVTTLQIDTILYSGPKDNRINYAFGNIRSDLNNNPYPTKSLLVEAVNNLLPHFDPTGVDARHGFSEYRNFFNLFSVWFADPILFESTPEYYEKTIAIRDAMFLPWATEKYGWITMIYTGGGGNGVGVDRDQRTGGGTTSMDAETVFHEFNHTMPGVSDEYTANGIWSNFQTIEAPNLTGKKVLDEIPWRKWIQEDTPIPTPYEAAYIGKVGLFEGNISGFYGGYRPTARSCYMGAGGFGEGFGNELCSVCLQRFIAMLYQYVNVIENPIPAESTLEVNGNETLTFSASFIKPVPNTQKYEWFLNGKLIATGPESIDVNFNACDKYTLELVVTDTTANFIFDEKFKDLYPEPRQTHVWTIDQKAVNSYNLSARIEVNPADCKGLNNGSIAIEPSGGLAPYSFTLNYKPQQYPINNLNPGNYLLTISDANNCSVNKNVEILQDPLLDFEICSEYYAGNWKLTAQIKEGDEVGVTYLWSNNSTDQSIIVNDPGTFSLVLTNSNSCKVSRTINLEKVTSPIDVTHRYANSTNGENNGAIYLEAYGGIKPYEITWFKGTMLDLTYPDPSHIISSNNGQVPPYHRPVDAFDNDLSYGVDFWAEVFNSQNFLGFDFGAKTTIKIYSITSNVDVPERDAKSWKLQGSDDGQNWTDLHSINGFVFPKRLQTFEFYLTAPASYRYFRLFFTESGGDFWIAIQQIEFGTLVDQEIKTHRNKKDVQGLAPGFYSYSFNDANNSCKESTILIQNESISTQPTIEVVASGHYKVAVSNVIPGMSYYWSEKNDGSNLLHIGPDFQPEHPGQYYVRPFVEVSSGFGETAKGFSVTMPKAPAIIQSATSLSITYVEPGFDYVWYDRARGGDPLHIGNQFTPTSDGYYFASARKKQAASIEPIDPGTIPGVTLWMDASDINGDGITDLGLKNSSAYGWKFRFGGQLGKGDGWIPYRANYQNGLGIADFLTVWFQYLDGGTDKLRTIIMAYQESPFSFPNSAPLHGLNRSIPRHSDASQLFTSSTPSTTLNGKTYLNGRLVNPLTEANPMEFMVLSVVLSELQNDFTFGTDEHWEGKLGELIIWDKPLTEEQILGINEFLQKKWISTAELESPRTKAAWGSNLADDKDQDGFKSDVDCDDENPNRNPAATEILYNGIDDDCNPATADAIDKDGDGFNSLVDCNDDNPTINPAAEDIPNNGVDENCDGTDLKVTGVTELDDNHIRVYPNPVSDFLYIDASSTSDYTVQVFNAVGQKILEGKNLKEIQLKERGKGIYLVNVIADDLNRRRKMFRIIVM